MMRRILVGAAIVGAALGFCAGAASVDVGPHVNNSGQQILSQFSIIDDVAVANDVLNDSVKYIDVLTLLHLQDTDANVLSNVDH
jgi:hypothetical protein